VILLGCNLTGQSAPQRALRIGLAVAASLLITATLATPAFAEEKIESFTTTNSTAQAGGHPDLETSFSLESPGEPEAAKNVIFNAPQGVFGNTNAITQCTADAFALDECPSPAQAGLITVYAKFSGEEIKECRFEYGKTTAYGNTAPCSPKPPFSGSTEVSAEVSGLTPKTTYHYRLRTTNALGTTVDGSDRTITPATDAATLSGQVEPELLGTAPIYDIVPQTEETARFAFVVPTLDIPIEIPVTVRTGSDYGLTFTVHDITQLTPLASAKLTFWGFPADESHNAQRFRKGSPGQPAGCVGLTNTSCTLGLSAGIDNKPLTDNPTTCTGKPLITTLEVQTYQDPEHRSKETSSYLPIEGCEKETFNPVLEASPTTTETDSPSGLNVELRAPQAEGHAASPSEIRSSIVTMPPGFAINPDAADGQSACTQAQANFGSEGLAECPDQSKIGTFAIGSPTLNGPLVGSVYIGEPRPGEQYRLFLIASGFGMNIKLVGSFKPNLETGQLTTTFEELPQLPFESFHLHLFSGERSLMATPTACTIYTVSGDFFPWDSSLADQTSTQVFGLETGPDGSQCPGQIRPFNPSLEAGTATPSAGAFSAFTLKLNREDGNQYLGKLNFTMPPGLTANLHGVTYCSEADITAAAHTPGRTEQTNPSCPLSSEIGTSNVAAGPGSHPFHAVGKIYMAGPFQGAPLSLVAITPALAGPYDYGTVVVRVALHIDPLDAHVIADSETVPEIIGGIPIRMRSIQVNIDKPKFMINPTNCSPLSVASEGVGDQGTPVSFSSYFHAVNCGALGFSPKMTITQLGGRKATKQGHEPSLRFDLNTTPGDANIKSVTVTLPKAFEIDQEHLGNICDRAELAKDQCKGKTPIGTVIDETPLLEKPLSGPAYAVSGYGLLPHVVFILGGQVTVMPQGESTSVGGGELKTVIPTVPDVPIGHFRLTLYGGSQGYLANTRNLCSAPAVSKVEIEGQNGKSVSQKVAAKTACKAKHKPKRHHRGRR